VQLGEAQSDGSTVVRRSIHSMYSAPAAMLKLQCRLRLDSRNIPLQEAASRHSIPEILIHPALRLALESMEFAGLGEVRPQQCFCDMHHRFADAGPSVLSDRLLSTEKFLKLLSSSSPTVMVMSESSQVDIAPTTFVSHCYREMKFVHLHCRKFAINGVFLED
jgi:hypothetical protein